MRSLKINNKLETTNVFDQSIDNPKLVNPKLFYKHIWILDLIGTFALILGVIFLTIRFTQFGLPNDFIIPTSPYTWTGYFLLTFKIGIFYFKNKICSELKTEAMSISEWKNL